MFLQELRLTNFKSHAYSSFTFDKGIVCFVGRNGVGKTNILDAIYFLCITKSNFNYIDKQLINHGQDFFRLDATFIQSEKKQTVVVKQAANKRKEFILNEIPYKKVTDHIGQFPIVFIAPDDNELILGGSEERRRFMDNCFSQISADYLSDLLFYNKFLEQRNAYLKQSDEGKKLDLHLLESYNEKMSDFGQKLFFYRRDFLKKLAVYFKKYYHLIAENKLEEDVSFCYQSQLSESQLIDLLKKNIQKDLITERCNYGTHKDDLEFLMNGQVIKKFGSQGQQKSFLIALKLAQFELIKTEKNKTPILLIDDIFDKLDNERSRALLQLFNQADFSQIFITHTDFDRIKLIAEESIAHKIHFFEIKNRSY